MCPRDRRIVEALRAAMASADRETKKTDVGRYARALGVLEGRVMDICRELEAKDNLDTLAPPPARPRGDA